jgi:NADH-quinone oxidoreductase subunit G
LHALALELGRLTNATVGFLGESGNVTGGHAGWALPSGANARQMFEQPRKAYVLMGIEPEFDYANPQVAMAALKQAGLVIFMSAFKHAPALEYADVMLPIAPFTETAGTFINIEGRVQSFNGVVKARGEARPAWKVLRVIGNVLDFEGFDYDNSEAVRDAVIGEGTEFVTGLDNGLNGVPINLGATDVDGLQRISDVPINFADPMARRSSSLKQTADSIVPSARVSEQTLAKLGLKSGDQVRVRQGAGEALLFAKLDKNVPDGCVRVSAAHVSTSSLGEMFGQISVERA